ncbi:hypothetical protein [Chitinophaga sp. RAB17]|uniref:hypothetical protein n=1 Tax=Chitinophaga sp. RAB17 TaxID=3233049 RepID=UPI003F8ED6AF
MYWCVQRTAGDGSYKINADNGSPRQLAALLGAKLDTMHNGTTFEVGTDVYMNSELVVPIFSGIPGGKGYGPDATSYPGTSIQVTYTIKN